MQPKNTGRAKTVTTLCLEKYAFRPDSSPVVSLEKGEKRFSPFSRETTGDESAFRQALAAHTFYTSPLIKSQVVKRKTFWLLILQLFDVKWIINTIVSFTKGSFNDQWNLSEEKIGTNFWNTLYTSTQSDRPWGDSCFSLICQISWIKIEKELFVNKRRDLVRVCLRFNWQCLGGSFFVILLQIQ